MAAKDVCDYAREIEAVDVENFMAETAGAMFKAAWMLKSTLRSKFGGSCRSIFFLFFVSIAVP